MREFEASIAITAEPERIWSILTELSSWPEWDPACERIEGRLELGAKLVVYSTLAPGRGFPVRVSELIPCEKMTWTGGMPLGLFRGVRTFTLRDRQRDSAVFTLHEVFSGPMLKLIGGRLPDMTDPFAQFVKGLKHRAELAA